MKKLLIHFMTIILTLLTTVSLVHAENLSVTGNTADSAVITDSKGNVIPHDKEISEWESVSVKYPDVAIPNDEKVNNGDTITITLPSNVQVKNNFDVPVKSKEGVTVGNFTINKGNSTGTITITNADYVNSKPLARHLYVQFGAYGKGEQNSGTDWVVNKVAWINQDNKNIVWNVAVNNQDGANNTIVIKDTPDANQELVSDTVQVQYGHYEGQKFVVERQGTLPITKTSDGFEVNLGKYSEKNAQITYETKSLTNGFVRNDVSLEVNGATVGTSSAEINYGAEAGYTGSSSSSSSMTSSSSSSVSSSASSSSVVSSSSSESSSSKVSSEMSSSSSKANSSSVESSSSVVPSSKEMSSSNVKSSKKVSSSKELSSTSSESKEAEVIVATSSNNSSEAHKTVSECTKSQSSVNAHKAQNKAHNMPKTGEKKAQYLTVAGLVILAIVGLIVIVSRKDKK